MRSTACPSRRSYSLAKVLMSLTSLRSRGLGNSLAGSRTFYEHDPVAVPTNSTDAINRVSWEKVQARTFVTAGDTFGHFQGLDRIPSILKSIFAGGHCRRHG